MSKGQSEQPFQRSFRGTSYLNTVGEASLNSRKPRIKCTRSWPCKRMACLSCRMRRRTFFVARGSAHSRKYGLSRFVTVSWVFVGSGDSWLKLVSLNGDLSKTLSGMRAGPFIRVISIGERARTLHAHYIVRETTADIIQQVVRKKWAQIARVHMKPIANIYGVLGYVFDQNFLPSYFDLERIKGIRLLSASRPMPTGFPTSRTREQA